MISKLDYWRDLELGIHMINDLTILGVKHWGQI